MSLLLKDPSAVLDYAVDWGADYLAADEAISTSQWSVIPDEAGGVSVAQSAFDASISTVKAGGGIAGRLYRLANRISTASGRTDERSITIRVEVR